MVLLHTSVKSVENYYTYNSPEIFHKINIRIASIIHLIVHDLTPRPSSTILTPFYRQQRQSKSAVFTATVYRLQRQSETAVLSASTWHSVHIQIPRTAALRLAAAVKRRHRPTPAAATPKDRDNNHPIRAPAPKVISDGYFINLINPSAAVKPRPTSPRHSPPLIFHVSLLSFLFYFSFTLFNLPNLFTLNFLISLSAIHYSSLFLLCISFRFPLPAQRAERGPLNNNQNKHAV
jgi:hypothetical protein